MSTDASSTPTDFHRERDAAVEAAWTAAGIIRNFSGELRDQHVEAKGVHDLVTDADREAQRAIIEVLQEAFPDYAVLAEEDTDHPDVDEEGRYRWIIDPIDGTTNFTHGLPPYAVSIALQEKDDLVVGVVLDVSRDELFTATRGGGAYLNGAPIRVSQVETLDGALLATGFPYRVFDYVDLYLSVFREFLQRAQGVRRPGAASIDLAYVACGRFDGFFETGLSSWDMAAGLLLVEEAGGRVTDYAGRPDPVFQRQAIVSNGRIHEAMLDIVAPMQDIQH